MYGRALAAKIWGVTVFNQNIQDGFIHEELVICNLIIN